ncbi:MAG: hypothetical protein GTN46_02345 [Gammaproteobacteria bacterium]|nr:hypothetical protein [Gammaproteobacteria bacterium]NIO61716.1 hypothetical protein [Gammaproteobacteria bacterium]NIQ18967.1 hypothetical protein [Gammaproteobacteria bacterium]NIT05016.1 hypothetical protein [Gammaproteobacteria bacterium]NIT40389.1 hypothetical protein [Gammaproteobacteria bacterium]
MLYYSVKIIITALLIVLISEIARRSSLIGAILASVPLVSILAMVWLYVDTGNLEKISTLSTSIFWLVLPSLALFICLPVLLKYGLNFYLSMSLSIVVTIICYFSMIFILGKFGIEL